MRPDTGAYLASKRLQRGRMKLETCVCVRLRSRAGGDPGGSAIGRHRPSRGPFGGSFSFVIPLVCSPLWMV